MVWFDAWWTVGRILVFGVLAFALLLTVIRLTGQRTIANMNASDFVITVAVGSTVATFLLSRDASFAEGVAALVLLLSLNAIVEWTSSRQLAFRRTTEGRPKLIFYEGQFLRDAMRREHVNEDEVRAVLRQQGVREIDQVHAVVLEINGTFSVLPERGPRSSLLQDVIDA